VRRLLILLLCGTWAACSNPNAPTTPAATATSQSRVIGLIGNLAFGSITVGSSAEATLTITNSGSGPLTVSSLTLPGGYAATWSAGTIAAGNSQAVTIRFTPTAAQNYNGSVIVNGDQTSGTNAISVSGTGVARTVAPSTAVVTGTVTDGTSRGVLPGILVQITSGPDNGKSVKTDGAGTYQLTVTPGAFTMQLSATSYITQTLDVTIASSTRVDVVLQRVPAPPPPPPAPSAPATARTSLSFVSDPGDYIGQGESHSYGLADGTWRATFSSFNGVDHVSVQLTNFNGPTGSWFWWYLDFAAPKGQRLTIGTYEAARRYPFQPPAQPGLSFSGSGRGCNELTGRFTITGLTIGPGDSVEYLAATFEQHCEGVSKALNGQVTIAANPWR
jgi:hypothetical protein